MLTIIQKLITIFGTIFIVTGIISLILSIIRKLRFNSKVKKKVGSQSVESEKGTSSRRIAVVTGASSGLGREFVRQIDDRPEKYDVSEIWIVARRKARLEELAEEISTPSKIFDLDLTESSSIDEIKKQFEEAKQQDIDFSISLLINCAGIGTTGKSIDMGFKAEKAMIDINDTAAVAMTQIALPYIKPGGRIMEISSVAAFQPIPTFNTYAASKVLLLWYSRALNIELAKEGISVTAVCPYWIGDTEFIDKASDGKQEAMISSKAVDVAKRSLKSAMRRDIVSTPGIVPSLNRIFSPVIAPELMARIAAVMSLHDKKNNTADNDSKIVDGDDE